jgi:hypothetical protein
MTIRSSGLDLFVKFGLVFGEGIVSTVLNPTRGNATKSN